MIRCHVCGGLLRLLGKLGRNVWGRCESCGSESVIPNEAVEDCEEDEE